MFNFTNSCLPLYLVDTELPAILKDKIYFAKGVETLSIQLWASRVWRESKRETGGDELVQTSVYKSTMCLATGLAKSLVIRNTPRRNVDLSGDDW